MNESNLDRALAAGFGASSEHSVLRAIERITGEAPRILLRDADSVNGASPVIDPSSNEKKSIPQGRGSYQILGEIARGGMGVVMKGHDTDLGRDVALKVLHKNLAQRPEVVQRFVEEAQIGGQLQHPGIVPVYELGLMADERPYFTMKLVKGRTLAVLLSERKIATAERRKLLDVFESVCQTLAYAHSRGVIHRDLKPANVMVGAFGEVQVVDWGLAKVLASGGTADEKRAKQSNISIIETVRSDGSGSGSHSLVGSVMGTPAYMPPEQARGEIAKIDERSDVFSLGAILCEILTGAPPYVGLDERTIEQAARAELDDATARLDGCAADADLIDLAKECLAPAQQARPNNAEAVAQRVHDYLISVEERATEAQVDAAGARVKAAEERKARKLTLSLAASVLATLVLAGGGWLWMSNEKSRRERGTETQVSAALSEATLKRGEGRWAEALAAVERAKGLADSGAASNVLRARVASDLAAIEGDAEKARAREKLARDNTALLAELADVRQPEGDHAYPTDWAKLDAAHRAIFVRHGLDVGQPNEVDAATALNARGIPVELGAALDEWAAVRSRAKEKTGATQLSSLARQIDGDATRGKLRDALLASDVAALKAFAVNEDLAQLPAITLNLLGAALAAHDALDGAIIVYRRAQLLYPGDFTIAMNLARTLLRESPPLSEEAARDYSAALALRPLSTEAIHELGRTLDELLKEPARASELFRIAIVQHPNDGHLLGHFARSAYLDHQFDTALTRSRRAQALEPNDAWVMEGLGAARQATGDLDGAVEAFNQAIALDPNYAGAYWNLGSALTAQHKYELAAAACSQAIALDPKAAAAYVNLGDALCRADDIEGSIKACHTAIDLDPTSAEAQNNLGNALRKKGKDDDAIECYRKAIKLDPKLVDAHFNLGIALAGKHDLVGAIRSYREAIKLDPNDAGSHNNLGNALKDSGEIDGAIVEYGKAILLDPKDATARSNLGIALLRKNDVDGALAAQLAAIDLDPELAMAHANLASVWERKGELDKAIASYQRAIELGLRRANDHFHLGNDFRKIGRLEKASECWRNALRIDPDHVDSMNNLAWFLATSMDPEQRDPAEAVRLARHAVQVASPDNVAWNTLGVALYVHGEPAECVVALQHSIDMHAGGDPNDWLFLAMAEHKLGHVAEARSWYEKSVQWLDKHPVDEELARFRLEAEQVLDSGANQEKQ